MQDQPMASVIMNCLNFRQKYLQEALSRPRHPALTEAEVSWICGQAPGFLGEGCKA